MSMIASMRLMRQAALLLALALAAALGVRPAAGAVHHADKLPVYDARQEDEALRALVLAERFDDARIQTERVASLMQRRDPALRIDLEPLFGLPVFVRDLTGALTDAPAQPLDPEQIVRDYIDAHPDLFGASADALLDNARRIRDGVTPHNGMTSFIWRQTHAGAEIVGAELRASVDAEGRLVAISSTMLPPPDQGFDAPAPALAPARGAAAAAEAIGAPAPEELARADDQRPGLDLRTVFDGGPNFEGLIETELVYLPLTRTILRPTFEVSLQETGDHTRYLVFVDAEDARTLLRAPLTLHSIEPATYRAYVNPDTLVPLASPKPSLPGPPAPNGTEPPEALRALIIIGALDPVASPLGWIDAGASELRGPNAWVYTDADADDLPDDDTQTGSAYRTFDFPIDLSLDPTEYIPASLTHAFYLANWFHDRAYQLGFTEEFANYQRDNFGRGGLDGDPMEVQIHDGLSFNNANFRPTDDGVPGVTQMFLWNNPSPRRDGALDSSILIHEVAHGLSTRLAGILGLLLVPQGGGLGEGWSDFYAISMLTDPAVDPALPHPVSGFSTFGFPGLDDDSHYYGIRRYPYSTDMNVAPLTFADIDPAQFEVPDHVLRSDRPSADPSQIHNIGEVWCSILWECRANLIEKHGPEDGNELMLRLVTDGLKLVPVQPNFVSARDAILLADAVNNDGENWPELWRGFAKRGLGFEAASPNGQEPRGVVESFDLPTYSFIHPEGRLASALPNTPIIITTRVIDPTPAPQPLTGVVAIVDIDGSLKAIDGAPTENPGEYRFEIPPQPCGAEVRYLLRATGPNGAAQDPPDDFQRVDIFLDTRTIIDDPVEQDLGWSLSAPEDDAWSGYWERTNPSGGPPIQPSTDATVDGDTCFHTQWWDTSRQAGYSMVNDGRVTLTTPRLDASGPGDVFVSWKQWTFISDFESEWERWLRVFISDDDGQTWTQLEETIAVSDNWEDRSFRVQDFVEPTDQVRVKFVVFNEFNWFRYATLPPPYGSLALCEAAIDDFRVTRRLCETPCLGDVTLDAVVSPADLSRVLSAWGESDPLLDLDDDGTVGPGDLAAILAAWGPCPPSRN